MAGGWWSSNPLNNLGENEGESELASESQFLHVALEWSSQTPLHDWST